MYILIGAVLLIAATGTTEVLARVNEPGEGNDARRLHPKKTKTDECLSRNNPVCADGETYQNECLAKSQGIKDYKNGPCQGHRHEFWNSDNKITKTEMQEFNEEGFKLVGRVKNHKHHKKSHAEDLEGQGNLEVAEALEPGEEKKITRTTAQGLVYKAKNFKPKKLKDYSVSDRTGPPPHAEKDVDSNEADGNKRSLFLIHGEDGRSKVSSFVWPHWRLGELDWGSSSEGGCSGSIVGDNKVLTAAHCVYDAPNKKWTVPSYFAPGRYRSSSGSTIEPWGRWEISYATVYTAWQNTETYDFGDVKYDVAILTMGTNNYNLPSIGIYMGKLDVIPPPSCTNAIGKDSRLTGYPSDKPDGEMWTSGDCGWWYHQCNSNIVYHQCDIWFAMSGSAIYDGNEKVFGVLSGGSSAYNAGYAFTSATKDNILSWGG